MMTKMCLVIAVFLFLVSPLWEGTAISDELSAASTMLDDVQRQLSSQTRPMSGKDPGLLKKLAPEPDIEIEKKEKKSPEEEGPIFLVKKINVEGNTAVPLGVLKPAISNFENRKTSFTHLQSFAEIITNIYNAKGYVTSRAYLPPQKIENNTVTVKVIEGKVGKIIVEGNRYYSAKSYEKFMKFAPDGIFRYQDLERSLYNLNQRPDRQAKAFLIPGEKLASSDIILKVKDKNPFHAYYGLNNHGTKLTHRARHEVHMDNNNLLGFDDILNTSFTMAEEGAFDGGSFYYNFPLENIPVTFSVSGDYVKTKLIGFLKPLEITGESLSLSPAITYSFIRSPEKTIEAYLGFEYVNSISAIDNNRISADRMRAIQLGPRIALQDAGGRTIINSDMHVGLPRVFGGLASIDANASVENSSGDFIIYTANVARLQRLPAAMMLLMRVGSQWTRDTLTSAEQYRAGGAYSVRGYPESDAAGDYGWSGGVEINMPVYFLPKDWKIPVPNTKKTWANSLRLVGFLDTAKTYFRERIVATSVKDKFLLGAGFGMRFDFDDYISAQMDMGWPLGDDSSDKNNKQVHLSMRAGF